MDCGNGEIHYADNEDAKLDLMKAFEESNERKLLALTENQVKELVPLSKKMRKNNMRNKPCICGSGVKFKRCCWGEFT